MRCFSSRLIRWKIVIAIDSIALISFDVYIESGNNLTLTSYRSTIPADAPLSFSLSLISLLYSQTPDKSQLHWNWTFKRKAVACLFWQYFDCSLICSLSIVCVVRFNISDNDNIVESICVRVNKKKELYLQSIELCKIRFLGMYRNTIYQKYESKQPHSPMQFWRDFRLKAINVHNETLAN